MSVATLTTRPCLDNVSQISIDCPHGRTDAVLAVPDDTGAHADTVVRLLLVRHLEAEGCRCTRKLWRKTFGIPWPEIPLVARAA